MKYQNSSGENISMYLAWNREWKKEGDNVCLCVCVSNREKEKEREREGEREWVKNDIIIENNFIQRCMNIII